MHPACIYALPPVAVAGGICSGRQVPGLGCCPRTSLNGGDWLLRSDRSPVGGDHTQATCSPAGHRRRWPGLLKADTSCGYLLRPCSCRSLSRLGAGAAHRYLTSTAGARTLAGALTGGGVLPLVSWYRHQSSYHDGSANVWARDLPRSGLLILLAVVMHWRLTSYRRIYLLDKPTAALAQRQALAGSIGMQGPRGSARSVASSHFRAWRQTLAALFSVWHNPLSGVHYVRPVSSAPGCNTPHLVSRALVRPMNLAKIPHAGRPHHPRLGR